MSSSTKPKSFSPISTLLSTSTTPRSKTYDSNQFNSIQSSSLTRAQNSINLLTIRLEIIERLSFSSKNEWSGEELKGFKDDIKNLDLESYLEIENERWLNGFCLYPNCFQGNSASLPYDPTTTSTSNPTSNSNKQQKLKLKSNSIFTSNPSSSSASSESIGPYCSKPCSLRSNWVKNLIEQGKNGEGIRIDLLEEVELRRLEFSTSVPSTGGSRSETEVRKEKEEEEQEQLKPRFIIKENPTPTTIQLGPTKATDFERPVSSSSTTSKLKKESRLPKDPSTSSLANSNSLFPSLSKALLKSSHSLSSTSTTTAAPKSTSYANNSSSTSKEPHFISEPMMVDAEGNEVNWSKELLELDVETEEEKSMMEEALEIRRMLREEGMEV